MYKEVEYVEKNIRGANFKIPINIYLGEKHEKMYFKKSKKINSPYDFLSFLDEVAEDNYNHIITRIYLKEKEEFLIESRARRSFTDLLGLYLTYYPEEDNEEGILLFTKDLKNFYKKIGTIGHYCTTPNKIVFLRKGRNSDFFEERESEEYPLLKGYFPDLMNEEETEQWEKIDLREYDYLNPAKFKDDLDFEKLRMLFDLCE